MQHQFETEEAQSGDSMTSYADLFAALAFIFLFLYIISVLKTSVEGISEQIALSEQIQGVATKDREHDADQAEEVVDYSTLVKRVQTAEAEAQATTQNMVEQVKATQEREQELIKNYRDVLEFVQSANQNLATDLESERTEKEILQAQMEESQSEAEQALAAVEQSKQQAEQAAKSAIKSQAQADQLMAETESLSEKLQASKDKVLELKIAQAAAETDSTELESQRSQIQEQLQQAVQALEILQANHDSTDAENKQLQAEIDAQKEKTTALQAELEDNAQELYAKQTEVTDLQGKERELQQQNAATNEQLAASQSAADKAQQQAAAAEQLAAGLAADKNKLQGERDELAGSLGDINDKLAAAEKSAQGLGDKLAAAQDKNAKLAGELEGLLDNQAGLAKAKAAADNALAANEAALAQLQDKAGGLAADKDDLAAAKAALLADKDELEAARDAAKDDLEKAQAELADLGQQQKDALAKIADAEKAQQQLANERDALADKATELAAKADNLEDKAADLEQALADTATRNKVRKDIVDQLKDNFAKAGINADINEKTGEVTLKFEQGYFDYGSATLKPEMESKLRRVLPIYAKSLFSTPRAENLVGNIEIIGYASPTYQGRVIDTGSLSPDAREALNYNLDLSYQRARSIFKYASNTNQTRFDYQLEFVKNLGVAGRSYLSVDEKTANRFAGVKKEIFCAEFDCDAQQSVILKFSLLGAV